MFAVYFNVITSPKGRGRRSVLINERGYGAMRYRDVGPRFRKHGGTVVYQIDNLRAWSRTYDYGSGPKHRKLDQERPSI